MPSDDEQSQFDALLAAYHEAIATGKAPDESVEVPQAFAERFRQAQDGVDRLHELGSRNHPRSSPNPALDENLGAGQTVAVFRFVANWARVALVS